MKKIKTDEAAISKALKEKDETSLEAFKMMTTYMKVYDEIHQTCHLNNIKTLYLENKNYSIIKLSNTLFTDSRSLTRYRIKYLKCFKFCFSIVKKFGNLLNFINKLI